jgi:translation initiation factor eIF-2B subunit gamma
MLTVLVPLVNTGSQAAALQHSTMHTGPKAGLISTLSGTGSPEEDQEDAAIAYDNLRIGLVLHRLANGCAARANTLNSFLDVNRRVCVFTLRNLCGPVLTSS